MRPDGLPVVDTFGWRDLAPGSVTRLAKRFAGTPDGGSATYPVIGIAGAHPGPVVTVVGGIHGDEYEGPAAIWQVAERLDPAALRGTVVLVPVAHTAAFAAGTRTSPIDGVNLARIFPGNSAGTITERLAADLFASVVAGVDVLIDLHSGGVRLAFVQVAGFYAAAEPAGAPLAAASLALATGMGLPHIWRLPPRQGVLSYEAMRAGIAACGCEAGGRGGCRPEDAGAYARGVLGVLADRGMIERPADVPHPAPPTRYLDGDFALAPTGGYLEPAVPLGATVQAGDLLATIASPDGKPLARLLAESPGFVMAERHLRAIQAGEWATCAVREIAL